MSRRKPISDEQLFALVRESHPPAESFPPSMIETEHDRVLSDILTCDRHKNEQQPRRLRALAGRRIVRTGALSVGAVLVLSGSALAAGSALGVIDLGGGDTAEPLTRVLVDYTAKNGKTYQVLVPSGTPYTYNLAGGTPGESAPGLACTDPELIVESDRALSSEELHEILLDESAGPTHVATDLLPEGVKSIGVGCKWAKTAAGTEPEAQANAQAEAEAEGWTAEKFREEVTTMADGGEVRGGTADFRGTPLPEAAPTGQGG